MGIYNSHYIFIFIKKNITKKKNKILLELNLSNDEKLYISPFDV